MTDQTLPPPLVPAEVDLRDFPGMWVDTDRLLKSETWQLGTGDEKAAAFTLWAESWHQVPAASLPKNDRMLAKLSQCERWTKSKAHALRGWIECSDGRLYHPVVAEKALEAWIEKLSAAISGAAGNAKRWKVEVDTSAMREQLRTAVDMLRALAPQSRAFKKKVVAVILAGSQPESGPESPPESPPDAPGASPPESGTDRKRPDLTRPDPPSHAPTGARAARAPGGSDAVAPPPAPEDPPAAPLANPAPPQGSRAGRVCKAIREAGFPGGNPGDAVLQTLLAQGATEAEFVEAAQAAMAAAPPKGWGWLLKRVEGRRADAAAVALAAPAPKPGEPSGRMPEWKPEPPMSADERARAEVARREAMAKLGRAAA